MKTIQQKSIIRYSISFRQMIVKEIEEGGCLEQVKKKYDIHGGNTVQRWIKNFGKNHLLNKIIRVETMDERNKAKQLEEENRRLKLALADAYMSKNCLEQVIRMADEEYNTDLKKNFGGQLPDDTKISIK